MLRFRRSNPGERPSSPLLRRLFSSSSSSTSTSRQASTESLSASLTDSIANSNAYSVLSSNPSPLSPPAPTVPLATLIHPLRYLSSSLYARIYELPRRGRGAPRLLKVC